jgi:hypothetical protein
MPAFTGAREPDPTQISGNSGFAAFIWKSKKFSKSCEWDFVERKRSFAAARLVDRLPAARIV